MEFLGDCEVGGREGLGVVGGGREGGLGDAGEDGDGGQSAESVLVRGVLGGGKNAVSVGREEGGEAVGESFKREVFVGGTRVFFAGLEMEREGVNEVSFDEFGGVDFGGFQHGFYLPLVIIF